MREIKYRAWHKKNEIMRMVDGLNFDCNNGNLLSVHVVGHIPSPDGHDPMFDNEFNIEICELMQFTGLLDKRGKEIYEGDIVVVDDVYNEDNPMICTWVVYEGRFNFIPIGNPLYYSPNHPCVIIGNRFENPELLGSEEVE